jgi:FixJ family two-component response regulator
VDEGIKLAEELRSSHRIPVVFVTGFSEEALFAQASEAKPVGFLRKPFSEAELIVCIESVLERGIAGEGLAERLPGIEAVSDPLPHGVIVSDLDGKVRCRSIDGMARRRSGR